MKIKRIILLIIPFLILACTDAQNEKSISVINFDSGFSLYQDTIAVDVKGKMTHALKYHDKLYVLFRQQVLKYGGYGKRWLYVFSDGQLEKVLDCPNEMKTIHLDFYVENDSIILKPYMDKQSYQLDLKNNEWNKIDKTNDLIFEDDNFQIFSLDFGEWGGTTWFKDKNTGNEYAIESTTPLINKINKTYYLTNPFKVLAIPNPLELDKCTDDVLYENIEASNKYYSWRPDPIGYNVVFEDTTFDFFNYTYSPHIVSSYVLKNELLHIYKTDTATYIAKVKNDSIKTIQKIAENISFYNSHDSYRCRNSNGNNELLKFNTEKEHVFGLVEMLDNKILVHYFMNTAVLRPHIVGTENADSIFVNRLNTILPDFEDLKLKKIDFKEQAWGSFDITPNHNVGIGDSWNPKNYVIDTCRSYMIKEDSIISNSIMYFATKKTDLVRAVIIEWTNERDIFDFSSKELANESFEKKDKQLSKYITQYAGEETKKGDDEHSTKIIWERPKGLNIELTNSKQRNNIRLVIFEDE